MKNKTKLRQKLKGVLVIILGLITSFLPVAQAFADSGSTSADTAPTPSSVSSPAITPATAPSLPPSAFPNANSAAPAAADQPSPSASPQTPSGATPALSPNAPDSPTTPTTGSLDQTPTPASPSAVPNPTPTPKPPSPPPPSGANPVPNVTYDSAKPQLPQIEKNLGALTENYPIAIPPGRNNFQPDLSLSYNSQNRQEGSPFGYGWSVSIPYIQRVNKSGINNLYSTSTVNYFTSSIDGELATTATSTIYTARTDNGSFNSYSYSGNQWTMTDKQGNQYQFGYDAAARQDNASSTSQVFKWLLEKEVDPSGNTISYAYYKDGGQIYPSSVIYTGNASTTGIFEIDFLTQSRSDVGTSYATGFPVTTSYRINEIDCKISGSWATKYALSYTTGGNGQRSLLSTITESGQDAHGTVTTLPATSLSYSISTTTSPSWATSTSFSTSLPVLVNAGDTSHQFTMPDVNGDSLLDFLYSYGTGTSYVSLASSTGWTGTSTPLNAPYDILTDQSDYFVSDVNGDGFPDLLDLTDPSRAYLGTGSGWSSSTTWILPNNNLWSNSFTHFADVNGDGLPDVLTAQGPYNGLVFFNTGPGWATSSSFSSSIPTNISANGSSNEYAFADVNGDGLMDFIFAYGTGGTHVSLNTGTGWATSTAWSVPFDIFNFKASYHVTDINGDGLPDLLYSNGDGSNGQIYLNTGSGWATSTNWTLPVGLATGDTIAFADVNGDGLPDILDSAEPPGLGFNGSVYLNKGPVDDMLTKITYPQGGNSTVSYKPTAQYTDSSGSLLNKVPYVLYTVSQITTNDSLGNAVSTSYKYQGGHYYYNTPFDRQFAGYSEITATDSAGNLTNTFYHTGSGIDSSHGEYQDNFWKIGKPYRIEQYDNSSNLYQKTINKWDVATSTPYAGFVKLAQTVVFDYSGTASHKDKAESYSYSNTTGNQTQKVQYGQVTGNDDGTFTDTGTDDFTTNISYASSSTSSVFADPYDIAVIDHGGSKVKESRFYYDALALGNIGAGNQTKQEDWKTGSTYANTQKTYNTTYGIVTQSKDADGNATNYSYDSFNLYPATVTNALSQPTQYAYNYFNGKAATTTDPNGNIFVNVYDGLGRVLQATQPNPSATSTQETRVAYTYTDTSGAVSIHEADYMSSTSTIDTYTYFDGLRRPTQSRKSSANAGIYAVKDDAYNNLGLLQKESLPYFSSGSATTTATSTTALFAVYAYDPLQRITTIANAVGTTTNAYNPWKVTATDANGNAKDLLKDAYGNLSEVDEHNSTSTYTTTYAYDYLGDLTKVTDALGNVRNFTYDGLGRRLTAQDLHASGDASFGSWSYTYDDAGNQTQAVNPNSQTVNYGFDALNRIQTEDYTGATGTEVTYTYDSCTQGKGRLCTASSSAVSIANAYDALGRITTSTSTISSVSYPTSYTYDRQGNQLTITNPDNSQVKYSYNPAGLASQVQRKESADSGFINVVSSFDYSPQGQPTSIVYANGVTTTNTYDPAKLFRLTQKTSTLPSTSKAQNISYTYDSVGNITQITNSSATDASSTTAYGYDGLNRLTSATANATPNGISGYTNTYTYDAIGNMLSRTESSTTTNYSYLGNLGSSYANPDAVTALSGNSSTTYSTIALDATSTSITSGFNAGPTTKTWPHTTSSGSGRLLVLFADIWQDVGGTGTISSASYGGLSLTKATSTVSTGMASEIWYLINPPSGTNTATATITGATDSIKLSIATFTGADQSSPLDSFSSSIGSSGNPGATTTTATANDLVAATLSRFSTTAAATNRTKLYNDATGSILGAASYQLASSSGAYSDTYTGSANQDWSMVIAAFKPGSTSSSGTTTSFSYDNNGNLLTMAAISPSATTPYAWDYNNRLTQTVGNNATTTYGYDPSGQRVKMTVATTSSATTYYPTRFYSITGSTVTKHIFTPDGLLLATIQPGSSSSSASVALDATSSSISNGFNAGPTTKTWTHITSSGSNRLLVLVADIWQDTGGTGTIASSTYNGVALTKATTTRETNMSAEVWYLVNPPSGSNTMSVTVTGATDAIKLSAASFTGIAQSLPLDAVASAIGTTGNPSASVTTAAANDLVLATLSRFSTTGATSSRTSLYKDLTGSILGAASYQLATSTGSYSDTYTGSANQDWAMVMAGFKAATATTSSTTVEYIQTDHLTGSNVITDDGGTVTELTDYYPYGSIRLDEQSGFNNPRKFAGTYFDSSTGLNYLNSRYLNTPNGKFLSEDPVFLAMGDEGQVEQLTNQQLQQYLSNPQSLNAYSYALDNPIINTDPNGLYPGWFLSAGDAINNNSLFNYAVDHPVQGGIMTAGASAVAIAAPELSVAKAVAGGIGGWLAQYTGDISSNITNGQTGTSVLQPRSSQAQYAASVISVSGTAIFAPNATPLAIGSIAAGASYVQDRMGNQPITAGGITNNVVNGLGAAATEGLVRQTAGIPGRIPGANTSADFIGAHAVANYTSQAVSAVGQFITSTVASFVGKLFGQH